MFERFRNRSDTRDDYVDENGGGVATATRHDTNGDGVVDERPVAAAPVTRETVRDVRARQRAEYGGLNWGSAFFGWLVAVGMATILLGLLSAAGAAFGLSDVSDAEARSNAETIGIVGGILLVATLVIAYYCGGYVSGRMSRFDGGRQGFGTWAIGLAVTIVLAVAGALFGAEYNVLRAAGSAAHSDRRGLAHRGRRDRACRSRDPERARRDGRRQGRRALPPQDRPARLHRLSDPLHQLTVERDVLAAVCPDLSEPGPERRQVDPL